MLLLACLFVFLHWDWVFFGFWGFGSPGEYGDLPGMGYGWTPGSGNGVGFCFLGLGLWDRDGEELRVEDEG